jgi:hypothetical protein
MNQLELPHMGASMPEFYVPAPCPNCRGSELTGDGCCLRCGEVRSDESCAGCGEWLPGTSPGARRVSEGGDWRDGFSRYYRDDRFRCDDCFDGTEVER